MTNRTIAPWVLALTLTLALPGCGKKIGANPAPPAPTTTTTTTTTTIVEHHYVYYPSCHVYYDTTERIYFYQVGSVWRSGAVVPVSITLDRGEGVSLKLRGANPTIYFDEHRVKFGPVTPGHGGPAVHVTGPDHDQQGGGGQGRGRGKRK